MRLGIIFSDIFEGGGYPRDVRWLTGALKRSGVDVSILGPKCRLNLTDGLDATVPVNDSNTLPGAFKNFDLVHVFGLFVVTHPIAAMVCSLKGTPLVVSPMAHLLPLHLALKRRKKELYLKLAWLPLMRHVRTFHVFSQVEADSVRDWIPDANVFEASLGIYPVPVEFVSQRSQPDKSDVRRVRRFLFFGRNDVYQKGLDILLEGFARALNSLDRQARSSMELIIAGQPWTDSATYLKNSLRRLQINDGVKLFGPADEKAKWRLLAEADYLVFLSRWDGPPRPIREAIAVGTPVIVTRETNMGELVDKFDAGLQVAPTVEAVAEALLRTAKDSNLLAKYRQGVQQLRRHLAWQRVAEDYLEGYRGAL
jgi:glycosyltransferase involved in cell wall biosynthesis